VQNTLYVIVINTSKQNACYSKPQEGHGLPNGIRNAFNRTVCMQFGKEMYVARLPLNINMSRNMIKYLCHNSRKLQAYYFVN